MIRKLVGLVVLVFVFMGVLGLTVDVRVVEAPYPVIYIMADGSIVPSTANITSLDNVTYSFVADINASIVVERSNIIIDGGGHTLQGYGGGNGISLSGISNVTIKDVNIKTFSLGIYLNPTSYSVISENNLANNARGIWLENADHNIISGNNIANNKDGIVLYRSRNNTIYENNVENNTDYSVYLDTSYDNRIYHNNFVDNGIPWFFYFSTSTWDAGYPLGGNYWSDYNGTDLFSGLYHNETGSDGLGDTPYAMPFDNKDNYPLMGMFSSFDTSLGYFVNVVCNSSIEDFEYFESDSTIRMYVSNMTASQTFGFCRVTVPKSLISPPYTVIIDDGLTEVLYFNDALYDNGTHRWIYFAYEHSTHKVVVRSDVTPPTISILSPENKTYTVNDVPLTFAISELTSWIGYSLDGQTNVTISGNTTIVGLSDGTHTITVYANDTAGNSGASETIYFTIETEKAESFPTWILPTIVIIAIVGVATLLAVIVYRRKHAL